MAWFSTDPRYMSLQNMSLTDLSCDQLRSTITLRFVDLALGRVNMGEQCWLGVFWTAPLWPCAFFHREVFINTLWMQLVGIMVCNVRLQLKFQQRCISSGKPYFRKYIYWWSLILWSTCSHKGMFKLIKLEFGCQCSWEHLFDKAAGSCWHNPYLNRHWCLFLSH